MMQLILFKKWWTVAVLRGGMARGYYFVQIKNVTNKIATKLTFLPKYFKHIELKELKLSEYCLS